MYCTYDNVPNQDIGGESSSNPAYGICEICPSDPEECMLKDFSSDLGLESCLQCDLECFNMKWGEMNLDIAEVTKRSANIDSSLPTSAATGHLLSYAPATRQNYSPSGTVKAPIVDCTADLAQDGAEKCTEADGAICLVEVLSPDTVYHQLAWKCEKSGGLALTYYQNLGDFGFSNDYPIPSTLQAAVSIPVVTLSYNTGSYLRKSMIGAVAEVSIVDADWHYCMASQACSKTIPCVGHHAQSYCYFLDGYHTDVTQYCNPCPEDPIDCYFPQHGGAGEWIMGQDTVESCASKCAPNLRFGEKCKLCGEALDVDFSFGVDDPDDRCNFCSDKNLRYPDRVVPLFSEGQGRDVLCWEVQAFFDRIDISKDSHNCALAQNQRYICGCEEEGGTAYAGTTNVAQRQTLVWVPRITAILSFMGSLCVFIHALRTKLLRESTFHQLMILLSLSDMLGSMAYAFTTLPIPSEYYFEGAHGNEATCIAQGFFIQLGTMSAYTNCSLAAYYYLVIKQGASENALRKHRPWLFTCPIVVGLAFAFAGIPFYDNVILWCNNAATWWPDIPVAIAIVVATCVMGAVCWDVYKKENASKKWRGANARNELSGKVFWQSFWFLMAFYGTWPPYLALQYAWASGAAFSHYGFILFAGIVVPLQGFWNFFVYGRTRFLKKGLSKLPTFSSSVTQRLGSSFFSLRRRSKSNEKATGSGASRSDSNTNSGIGGTIRRLSAAITGLGLKRGQEVVPNNQKSSDKNNAGEVKSDEIKAENEEECGESGKIASGEAKVSDEKR